MAHLVKCWCGKIYRCDIEHLPTTGCCRFILQHDRNCPDQVLHGNPAPPRFERVYLGVPFENKELVWPDIKKILEDNSVKDSQIVEFDFKKGPI